RLGLRASKKADGIDVNAVHKVSKAYPFLDQYSRWTYAVLIGAVGARAKSSRPPRLRIGIDSNCRDSQQAQSPTILADSICVVEPATRTTGPSLAKAGAPRDNARHGNDADTLVGVDMARAGVGDPAGDAFCRRWRRYCGGRRRGADRDRV